MSTRTARRLHDIPPTIFTTMSSLAQRTGAINLGQGFPDEDGPDAVIEAAVSALRGGRNQYAPGPGVPELRTAVARHQERFHGLTLDPQREVVVTAGATEAIAASVFGLVDPGDEVVVVEPYYDAYVACVEMAGAIRRTVTLRAPAYRLEAEDLRSAVTDRTVAIIVNSPHNPTGRVLDAEERQAVADVALAHDLVVLSDEVYEHLVYDGRHVPLATMPGMFERTVTISSAGKMFSLTGWKVGWVTGPQGLVDAVLSAKQWLTFTNASPLQPAIAYALDHETDYAIGLAARLRPQRDLLCEGLRSLGMDVTTPEGTYFALSDVRGLGYDDGMAFCLALPERAGVVAIPAQVFHDDQSRGRHLVRWAFCKERAALEEALERLAGADLTA
jgi:N-succinyldiaminopimelate aminotransferase